MQNRSNKWYSGMEEAEERMRETQAEKQSGVFVSSDLMTDQQLCLSSWYFNGQESMR